MLSLSRVISLVFRSQPVPLKISRSDAQTAGTGSHLWRVACVAPRTPVAQPRAAHNNAKRPPSLLPTRRAGAAECAVPHKSVESC